MHVMPEENCLMVKSEFGLMPRDQDEVSPALTREATALAGFLIGYV
jgi:hypothetical protein